MKNQILYTVHRTPKVMNIKFELSTWWQKF